MTALLPYMFGLLLLPALWAAAPGSFQADHSAEAETHLFARLTDPANAGASAKVQYESEQEGTTLEQSLSVQVRGAEANATLDVTIDGIGTLVNTVVQG